MGPGSRVVDAGDFRVIRSRLPAGFRIPEHTHDRHNLAYTVTGGVRETFGREQVRCRPGNVLLKPAGAPHADWFDARETITLQLEWRPDITPLAGPALDRVLLFGAGEVSTLAARLYAELHAEDDATAMIAEGLALEMVGRILRSRAPGREDGVPRWLSRVRDRLHDEPGAGLAIGALAAEAGVRADHLGRRFREVYGMTVGTYLRRIRLERAAAALIDPAQRLSEIALRAGFADQAHFTREFKRAFGVPPGAYRRATAVSAGRAASSS
jgi:AraC family transcriptional regulator